MQILDLTDEVVLTHEKMAELNGGVTFLSQVVTLVATAAGLDTVFGGNNYGLNLIGPVVDRYSTSKDPKKRALARRFGGKPS